MKRLIYVFAFLVAAMAEASAQTGTRYLELCDSVDCCMKENRLADAEQFIHQALSLEPGNFNNALLFSNLGVIQTRQGKYDEALANFEVGLTIAPRSTTLLSNRARTLMEAGRSGDALQDLSAALAINPKLTWERKMRAYIYLQNGNADAAAEDFERLHDVMPNDPDALVGLAQCAYLGGRMSEAIDLYGRAIDNAMKDADRPELVADLLEARCWLYLDQDRLDEARADITEAIRLTPMSGDLFAIRAYINALSYLNREVDDDLKTAVANGADEDLLRQLFPKRFK